MGFFGDSSEPVLPQSSVPESGSELGLPSDIVSGEPVAQKSKGRPRKDGSPAQPRKPVDVNSIRNRERGASSGRVVFSESSPEVPVEKPVYFTAKQLATLFKLIKGTANFISPVSREVEISEKEFDELGELWEPTLPILFPQGTGKYTPVFVALIGTGALIGPRVAEASKKIKSKEA